MDRRLFLAVLRRTGLMWLWRLRHRSAVIILTVHGVMNDAAPGHVWRPLRARLSPERLDQCLRVLKASYHFVSLDEAADMLAGRCPLRPRSIVLTFDDGYRNHLTEALPVLQKHGVPATVFVSTGPVESRKPFWFDRLDYAVQQEGVDGRTVSIGRNHLRIDAGTRERLVASYAALRELAKAAPRDDREMCDELHALAAGLERDKGRRLVDILEADPWSAVLTVDEIRAAPPGLGFGSHTVDHLRLHRLDEQTIADQLRRSKADLESWTGQRCRFFCYPDGGFSAVAAALVRQCGYDAAVTGVRGLNYAGDDPMTLRRIDVPVAGSATELIADVSGLKDWLLSARAAIFRRSRDFQRSDGGAPGRSNAPAS